MLAEASRMAMGLEPKVSLKSPPAIAFSPNGLMMGQDVAHVGGFQLALVGAVGRGARGAGAFGFEVQRIQADIYLVRRAGVEAEEAGGRDAHEVQSGRRRTQAV